MDIFIRQQSRECETIIEEDEADLSEWYSTRTSQGIRTVSPTLSPPGSNRRRGSYRRPDSPLKIVEFHPSFNIPTSDLSQVDSHEIAQYPFYNKIKKQVLNLNFETSSDWSEEARFLDELREVGVKDEGRLTYHEMLLAYRRSQGIRRSTAKSNQSESDDSDSTSDLSDSFIIDYLPEQTHNPRHPLEISRPEDPRENPGPIRQHSRIDHAVTPTNRPPVKADDIYIRLADNKKNFKRPVINRQESDRPAKPVYNQSVYGQFRRANNYQSYPNYPRYRRPVRPNRPQTNHNVYLLLAFLLLGLMIISFIPIMFI